MGYTKIHRSGDIIEVYSYEKDIRPSKKERAPNSFGKRNRGPRSRTPENLRRASKAFSRLVRANLAGNESPALLTLTMYQKLPYAKSSKLFTDFIVRLRKRGGALYRYIAVPEFQKRGATHWHVLIWGISDEKIQTERETRYFARLWLRGFCDITKTDGHPKIATYLTKYMRKAMQDIRHSNTKAYYASRNVVRPMQVGSNTLSDYIGEIVDIHSTPLTEKVFDTQWLGRCHYKVYKI